MWRFLAVMSTLIVWASAKGDEEFERALRTLEEFSVQRRVAELAKRGAFSREDLLEVEEERGLEETFQCKAEGAVCNGVIACCDELHCYWENGRSPLKDPLREGKCVDCVAEDLVCQRDAQCCEGLHCEKEKSIHINGKCTSPGEGLSGCVGEGQKCRSSGVCCNVPGLALHCDKAAWWHIDGKCGRYRRKGSCFKNAQCVTKCEKKWYQIYGVCI